MTPNDGLIRFIAARNAALAHPKREFGRMVADCITAIHHGTEGQWSRCVMEEAKKLIGEGRSVEPVPAPARTGPKRKQANNRACAVCGVPIHQGQYCPPCGKPIHRKALTDRRRASRGLPPVGCVCPACGGETNGRRRGAMCAKCAAATVRERHAQRYQQKKAGLAA